MQGEVYKKIKEVSWEKTRDPRPDHSLSTDLEVELLSTEPGSRRRAVPSLGAAERRCAAHHRQTGPDVSWSRWSCPGA